MNPKLCQIRQGRLELDVVAAGVAVTVAFEPDALRHCTYDMVNVRLDAI
jgi:hypothetical protein